MTTLTLIKSATLKALLRFAAVKDSRYYLVGVHIEPEGYAVATNGHILLAARIPAFEGAASFIIPSAACKLALQLKVSELAITLKEQHAIGGIPFIPIDGRYPEWRRIVPTELPSGKPGHYSPKYLQTVVDAFRDMGMAKSIEGIEPMMNGADSAALAVCENIPDAIAVLMPYRTSGLLPGDAVKHVKAFLAKPAG